MSPEDAIELLDQAVAQINGPRQLHIQLQQAIDCLRDSIGNSTQPKDNSTPPKDNE